MDGTTVFCGSARTGSARGGSRGIAAGDSPSFVIKLMQRWRRRGTLAADRIGGGKRSKSAALEAPARQGGRTRSVPPPRARAAARPPTAASRAWHTQPVPASVQLGHPRSIGTPEAS